jgi:hypothetical protein
VNRKPQPVLCHAPAYEPPFERGALVARAVHDRHAAGFTYVGGLPMPSSTPGAIPVSSFSMRMPSPRPSRSWLTTPLWRRPRALLWYPCRAAGPTSAPGMQCGNSRRRTNRATRRQHVEGSRNCNVVTDHAVVGLEGIDDLVVVATPGCGAGIAPARCQRAEAAGGES